MQVYCFLMFYVFSVKIIYSYKIHVCSEISAIQMGLKQVVHPSRRVVPVRFFNSYWKDGQEILAGSNTIFFFMLRASLGAKITERIVRAKIFLFKIE